MSEEMNLVADLALILVAAGVFTIISKALRQPLILGYIVAGFVVGPHLGLFPDITSTEAVNQWSEIGIIFLLFALGLEFSFKKLLKIGSSALITAGTICIGMFLAGIITGRLMSWSMMESIFLGGMLSMSSTTIIIKSYDDLGLKNKPYAALVFGSLVFEDLIAVLLMVLLSTMAVSNKFAGGEMIMGLAKLAFFLILWFLVGIYLIPTMLKKAQKYLNDEILLIVAIGLCFGMVALASYVGFSSALGAFVMGSILAETLESEHIRHLVSGIKDLFGAIFFVSVGMMVDPAVIGQHWGTIIILALVSVCGILLFSTSGSILSGQGLENSVHTGFSMAQLGEFAFIIAGLGSSLGVLRDFIYPVVIAVSVLTTFTTPYMIKAADPAYAFLNRHLPEGIINRINASTGKGRTAASANEWRKLIKDYLLRITLYGVVLIAISIGSHLYLDNFIERLLPSISATLKSTICVVVTLTVMSPFLVGLAVKGSSIAKSSDKLLKEKEGNFWPVIALALLRIFIAMYFVLFVVVGHFDISFLMVLLILVVGVLFFFLARKSLIHFSSLEDRFIANLNEKEMHERRMAPVTTSVNDKFSGYDVHTELFDVPQESVFAGKCLKDLPLRDLSGANIVKIMRGKLSLTIPSGDEMIFPGDRLLAVGTSEQLESLSQAMCANVFVSAQKDGEFELEPLTLQEDSYLTGKTLREADMRSYGCMVISLLHDGELIANPKPDYRFRAGDVVWLAGEKSACDWWG